MEWEQIPDGIVHLDTVQVGTDVKMIKTLNQMDAVQTQTTSDHDCCTSEIFVGQFQDVQAYLKKAALAAWEEVMLAVDRGAEVERKTLPQRVVSANQ